MEKGHDSFFLNKKKGENKQKVNENGEFKKKRQEEFNKSRKELIEKTEKKPFDKKAYRFKKYSKKYKLDQWEENRKKKLMREYQNDIKNDHTPGTYKPKSFDEDVTDSNQDIGKYVRHPDIIEKLKFKKRDPFQKAKEQYNKVKQEKLEKQQQMERVKKEKLQKLEEYKKKKHDRFKKLSKKTNKGQPVMTGRLELLLEKIQKS